MKGSRVRGFRFVSPAISHGYWAFRYVPLCPRFVVYLAPHRHHGAHSRKRRSDPQIRQLGRQGKIGADHNDAYG
jgi:hypothetical protein